MLRKIYCLRCGYLMLLILWAAGSAMGQQAVRGKVTDRNDGSPMPGVNVLIKGTTTGTQTDDEGHYLLPDVPQGAVLVFSYIGKQTQETPVSGTVMDVSLADDSQLLSEIVVIGYGTQKKNELTGAVSTITAKEFQKGVITTPDQLISGKVAGVQITPNGGRPGSGSTIRIRAGASLNASNDPLIVIDGVPVSGEGISGSPNPLSLINPSDIETFTVLKDASATAIYGSRASNGVIMITTKKGVSGKPKINFSTQNAVSVINRKIEVLSPDQLRTYVSEHGSEAQKAMLGTANTDWQDEIYQAAFSTDNNLSISGSAGNMPYRVGVGYLNQDGILKRDNLNRISGAVTLNPRFFDKHLKVDLNLKGSMQKSFFANQGAIFTSIQMDPTKPVYEENSFGNFYEWKQGENPHPLAPRNPVGLIEQKEDNGKVLRSFGNLQLDYAFHFLPELRANLNLGYDISRGEGDTFVPAFAAQNFNTQGNITNYKEEISNKVLEFFFNYNKAISSINSQIDVTAGYGYYDNQKTVFNFPTLRADGSVITTPAFATDVPQNRLISYFGRLIYTLNDRYIVSGTLRTDGSSRFSPENRWGVFPSAAVTWRLAKESFLENSTVLSDLNLRLSYGITGQQDGIANYSYLPNYNYSVNESRYQLGSSFYNMYSPVAYDAEIRWESTATSNIGLDYGFLRGRLNGSLDVYYKKTRDLLSTIPIAVGTNFSNLLLTNVGNMENKGFEFNISAIPVLKNDLEWNMNFNFTYNNSKVTNLTAVDDPGFLVEQGWIEGSTGNNIQAHTINKAPFSYRVYKQVYNAEGKPLEGVYADLNGDGKITDDDRYYFKSPMPKYILGFSTGVNYKRWNISTTLRSNLDNYVYDNVSSNMAISSNVLNPVNIINNAPADLLNTNFQVNQYMSDYYVYNASFLKMDNLTLSYNVGEVWKGSNLSVSGNIQNVFTLTNYHGVDPEIYSGIDNRFYPRPRTYVVGLNLSF